MDIFYRPKLARNVLVTHPGIRRITARLDRFDGAIPSHHCEGSGDNRIWSPQLCLRFFQMFCGLSMFSLDLLSSWSNTSILQLSDECMMSTVDIDDVSFSLAKLQAWTSLSFSTQSGRHAVGNRSRTVSPSVGSIRLNTHVDGKDHGTIASPIAEGNENPAATEDAHEATPPLVATESKG